MNRWQINFLDKNIIYLAKKKKIEGKALYI